MRRGRRTILFLTILGLVVGLLVKGVELWGVIHREFFTGPAHHEAALATVTPQDLGSLLAGRTSDFPLDVTVDRFDGGRYAAGDAVGVRLISGRGGFLILALANPSGDLSVLVPTAEPIRVAAGEPFEWRPADSRLIAGPTPGVYRLHAVVTALPVNVSGGAANPAEPEKRFSLKSKGPRDIRVSLNLETGSIPHPIDAGFNPHSVFGPFAQDAVDLYVGPSD